MDARKRRAQSRLQRDLKELADRSWELPTVSALPLEDDIMEWHCNIVGGGEEDKTVLHLKLLFPDTYPHQPPEVVLMSRVFHPNVFGDHVCLDMLEEGQWSDPAERDAEFTGWSTCYSVFSILMQLQCFLLDFEHGIGTRTQKAAMRCECFCGHGGHRVYPPLPEPLPPPPRPPVQQSPFEDDDDDNSSTRDPSAGEVTATVIRADGSGAVVSIGDGRVGTLLRSDMPRGRWLERGDEVKCRAKAWEPNLALTMLRSEEELASLVSSRSPVQATVTSVKPFGVFVDLGGAFGFLHRSETDLLPAERIPWSRGESLLVRLLGGPAPKLAVSSRSLYLRPWKVRKLCDGGVDNERLRCFHSKETFAEGVLGVGVSLEPEEVSGGLDRYHLTSIYDVLAFGSFKDGVRRGVWKQRFSLFLPLAIDLDHFQRAQRAIEDSLAKLSSGKVAEKTRSHGKSCGDKDAEYRARVTLDEYRKLAAAGLQQKTPTSMGRPEGSPFVPEMVFEVIPKLMNSQVVLLGSGQLWRCQKVLEGYFAYHHLLLHCLRAYPRLRSLMEAKLEAFLTDPAARKKEQVPNLGEFICLVSVSDKFDWDMLGVPMLEETFARNVLWILKRAPRLGTFEEGVSRSRLKVSFDANRTSLRLLMFQVAFLQLAKPTHVHEARSEPCRAASCALNRKDRCKGLPGPGEAEWLFDRCVDILDVHDFSGFLELAGAGRMEDIEICHWLRRSVIESVGKGYHNPGYFRSLAQKSRSVAQNTGEQDVDPEDFVVDSRVNEGKGAKRARKRATVLARAVASQATAEYRRALVFARFQGPAGFEPRQACLFIARHEVDELVSELDADGKLKRRFHRALPSYRLLDGVTAQSLSDKKIFPCQVWLGLGCTDCKKPVTCEVSGRCMPCCHAAAKAPVAPKAIKGLSGADAPVARFAAFDAQAVMPVEFELRVEVAFDGLVADISTLRDALAEDLTVKQPLAGLVFTRVTRAGIKLWEKSPEQTITFGSKLTTGWQGLTDAVLKLQIRNVRFVLLERTMRQVSSLGDLSLLRMVSTSCRDHAVEAAAVSITLTDAVDHALLKSRTLLLDALKSAIKRVIVAEAGIGVLESHVELDVVGGSPLVLKSKVIPPNHVELQPIVGALSRSEALAMSVAVAVAGLPGLGFALRGAGTPPSVGTAKVVRLKPTEITDEQIRDTARSRVCTNCRGLLRLHFAAARRHAERLGQLQYLGPEQLVHRAQLCGLAAEASDAGDPGAASRRKELMNLIIKSEGIMR